MPEFLPSESDEAIIKETDVREMIERNVFDIISRFMNQNNQQGMRQKFLYEELKRTGFTRYDFNLLGDVLADMEKRGVIYKEWQGRYPYWYVKKGAPAVKPPVVMKPRLEARKVTTDDVAKVLSVFASTIQDGDSFVIEDVDRYMYIVIDEKNGIITTVIASKKKDVDEKTRRLRSISELVVYLDGLGFPRKTVVKKVQRDLPGQVESLIRRTKNVEKKRYMKDLAWHYIDNKNWDLPGKDSYNLGEMAKQAVMMELAPLLTGRGVYEAETTLRQSAEPEFKKTMLFIAGESPRKPVLKKKFTIDDVAKSVGMFTGSGRTVDSFSIDVDDDRFMAIHVDEKSGVIDTSFTCKKAGVKTRSTINRQFKTVAGLVNHLLGLGFQRKPSGPVKLSLPPVTSFKGFTNMKHDLLLETVNGYVPLNVLKGSKIDVGGTEFMFEGADVFGSIIVFGNDGVSISFFFSSPGKNYNHLGSMLVKYNIMKDDRSYQCKTTIAILKNAEAAGLHYSKKYNEFKASGEKRTIIPIDVFTGMVDTNFSSVERFMTFFNELRAGKTSRFKTEFRHLFNAGVLVMEEREKK